METIVTDILVIGGGVGGTAAAIQAARRGAQVILVSEFPWLGGMLTSAGVSVPDGNELESWQTGLWGSFLRSLTQGQPGGLHHSWVSFFSYQPAIGAAIFAQWVSAVPNLTWLVGGKPLEVLREGDRIGGAVFQDYRIRATLTLDGTELGDCLALGNVPHRWGWEAQEIWQEPSAPPQAALEQDPFYAQHPVQAPTWVVVLQDFGEAGAPEIAPPPTGIPNDRFDRAWQTHGAAQFLSYGQLPGNRLMINWPIFGNDYDRDCQRLIGSPSQQQAFQQEALWHSQAFAYYIQHQIQQEIPGSSLGHGKNYRYGLAVDTFPRIPGLGGNAYALHPYYRESRRLVGLQTVREQDILPLKGGTVAPLPLNAQGEVTAIAVGNYVNDHHYTQRDLPLAPKALRWGGRWTGTPFSLPYGCLVPETVDGLLVCEKNIAVSHIANGATRLQPVVMTLGQAAGMAAALCVEQGCAPRDLPVRSLQLALLTDPQAPAAIVPFFDLLPDLLPESQLLDSRLSDSHWLEVQRQILDQPDRYPVHGYHREAQPAPPWNRTLNFATAEEIQERSGVFHRIAPEQYEFELVPNPNQSQPTFNQPSSNLPDRFTLVTLNPAIQQCWQTLESGTTTTLQGIWNPAGQWFLVTGVGEF